MNSFTEFTDTLKFTETAGKFSSSQPFQINPQPSIFQPTSQPTMPFQINPQQPEVLLFQPIIPNHSRDDLFFDPLPTNNLSGLTISNPHQPTDAFDFPALKHPSTLTSTNGITPLQPPPPRTIRNDPQPSTKKTDTIRNPDTSTPTSTTSTLPECPICGLKFKANTSNDNINAHVDECLKKPPSSVPMKDHFGVLPQVKSHKSESEPWAQWFDLSKMEWYFGAIDRKEAEKILYRCIEDSFVVRKSSVKDSFALSLYSHKKQSVTHTLIEPRHGGYSFQDSTRTYPTILDLITKSPECGGLRPPPKVGVSLEM